MSELSLGKTKATAQADEDESCLDVFGGVLDEEPGILALRLDTNKEEVALVYDPQQVPAEAVLHVAETMGPQLQERWQTCVLRVGRTGGRACETCAAALESKLQEMPGVRRASASYLGGVLSVTYDEQLLTETHITERVAQLGVPLRKPAEEVRPTTIPGRVRAYLTSDRLELIFTVVTFFTMFGGLIAHNQGATTLGHILYAVAYVAGGTYGLRAGLESLRQLTIDVDLLMILAAVGAAIVGAPFEGAMLLFLFSLSNVLQNYALDRTRNAIRALMALRPEEAQVRRGDRVVTLPLDRVRIGDRMMVRPGERIALDGVIIEGSTSVDQAAITGESIPVPKSVGETVLAGTINQTGALEVGVTKLAKDSTIAKLIQMVEEAQSEKAKTQRFIDKAEQYYALGVIVMTALAFLIPAVLLGEAFGTAFYRAMTLMVAASPCAIVISTPATVLSAIANGARRGVLFKGGAYVEQAAEIKVVAFDKTGTLTSGQPQVTDVWVVDEAAIGEQELLLLAAAVEVRSAHPLAQAIVTTAHGRGLTLPDVVAFQSETGKGVRAMVEGRHVAVGNRRYFEAFETLNMAPAVRQVDLLQDQGKTSVIVAELLDGEKALPLGVIGIADVVRPDAPAVVQRLKAYGVEHVVMLTGDNQRVAQAIAAQVGVDEFFADLLPEDKMQLLKDLARRYGPVAMVGDGVNDAPALATADIGIAMGAAGTDVAMETADIVLMADDLQKIPYVIALSRKTRKTLVQNLVFAMGMIVVLILAVLGFNLALPLSVIGHEGSTVLVSLNGLRMLGFKE